MPTTPACLFVLASPSGTPAVGACIPLDADRILGRAVTADVPIHDSAVARRHARLVAAGDTWTLTDHRSTNGTLVNDASITECVLASGDRIQIGEALFVFLAGHDLDARVAAARAHLAQHDPFTGALTRAALTAALARERSAGHTPAVLVVKPVELEQLTTRYGPLGVNRLIVALAARVRALLAPEDALARVDRVRLGALLTGGAPAARACALALRAAVASAPFDLSGQAVPCPLEIASATDTTTARLDLDALIASTG